MNDVYLFDVYVPSWFLAAVIIIAAFAAAAVVKLRGQARR
jgi:hypothetical protein